MYQPRFEQTLQHIYMNHQNTSLIQGTIFQKILTCGRRTCMAGLLAKHAESTAQSNGDRNNLTIFY